jgi:GT2 family glycosyltransferase
MNTAPERPGQPAIPSYVVIPVKNNLALTSALVAQLRDQGGYETILVFDNGSTDDTPGWLAAQAGRGDLIAIAAGDMTLHQMWNAGVSLSRARHPACNIAILNNDLRIGPGFLARLGSALRADLRLWAVSPNYDGRPVDGVQYVTSTFKRGGLAGFAFMVRGEAFDDIAFDEHFSWWYGDDDLVAQIYALSHRAGIVAGVTVDHIDGGSRTVRYTATVRAAIELDRQRMIAKWCHD